ncbi:MAG: hypothetical protein NWP80_02160, partial [Candidatus Gracilibacteria bacterium]|nr:hypothetical protein [Candidatus Gracilibacteria bacterium]
EGITGKYNFVNNHVLRLSGVTKDKEITDIHINNDRLNYPNGTPDFSYTLSLDNKNIKEGENKYDVFITKGGKKELLETFYVTYYDDREKINNLKKEYLLKNSKEEDIKEYNSKLKEIKEKLKKIDENFYYNENFYPYEIKFNYIDGRSDVLKTANIIKNQLEKYGIKVQKSSITAIDLQKKVTSNNKDYDMILIGIDLGVFNINLFPYFHSSQAKDLYNLSNIKDSELDDLLENLKNNLFKPDEIIEKQNKVIEKLKNYNIVKTIYNKSNYIYFDKNINNIDFKNPINNILSFYDKLKKANVVFQKEINLENKGIIYFFIFIKKLF